MDAKLNIKVFENNMKDLGAAYNYSATKRQMEIYYYHLHDKFTNESFKKACDKILVSERFFPALSVFFENNEIHETKEEILKRHGF